MPPLVAMTTPGAIGRERFADEPLGDFGAVGVGGVDERDAKLDGAAQDAAAFFCVGRLAPRAVAHQAHGSVAEPVHGQVAPMRNVPPNSYWVGGVGLSERGG